MWPPLSRPTDKSFKSALRPCKKVEMFWTSVEDYLRVWKIKILRTFCQNITSGPEKRSKFWFTAKSPEHPGHPREKFFVRGSAGPQQNRNCSQHAPTSIHRAIPQTHPHHMRASHVTHASHSRIHPIHKRARVPHAVSQHLRIQVPHVWPWPTISTSSAISFDFLGILKCS